MRASSQGSLDAARDRWEPVLGASGERAFELGLALLSVMDTIDSSPGLRRALTEPTREGADKVAVVTALFGGKVPDEVVDLLAGMVRSRWSTDADLPDAVNILALGSVLAGAEARGELERVEEELFRVTRLLAENRDLRLALADVDIPVAQRVALVDSVFSGKVTEETATVLRRAVGSRRERSITSALTLASEMAAQRRHRLVAVVTAAAPLSSAQVARLAEILGRAYGREVQVNLAVDPSVVGGLRIQIGDDMVDSTMLTRLDEARRRLAG